MKIFVSVDAAAQESRALNEVLEVIAGLGHEAVGLGSDIAFGSKWIDVVSRDINSSDAVIGVVSNSGNPGVWFQLGVAAASRLPALIVSAERLERYPNGLESAIFIGPNFNRQSLRFAIERMESTVENRDLATSIDVGMSGALDVRTYEDLRAKLSQLEDGRSGRAVWEFERWFADVLEKASILSAQPLPGGHNENGADAVDFAVDIEGANDALGSVLFIELKTGTPSYVKNVLARRSEARSRANVPRLVVCSRTGAVEGMSANVLIVSAEFVLDSLLEGPLGLSFMRARNQFVRRREVSS